MPRTTRLAAIIAASLSLAPAITLVPVRAQTPPPPPAQAPPATTPPAPPANPPAAPAAPAATSPAPAPPPAIQALTIPDGTEIKVTLQKELKSGTAKEGDTVPFMVEKDVKGPNGSVFIKAGSQAVGRVLQSKPHGFIGKPGKLEFTCDYIVLPGGGHLPLRSTAKTKYGQNNTTASVAAAVVLTPVALLLPGKDTTAREGQEFTLYTGAPAMIASDGTLVNTGTASSASTPASGKSAFLLIDGTTTVGTLASFDGSTYTVNVDGGGTRTIKASEVKNITPVK